MAGLGRVIISGIELSEPLPDTPIQGGFAFSKDTFSVGTAPSLVGRNTNSDEGLTVQAWQGSANSLAINNGVMVRGAGTDATFSNQLSVPSSRGAYAWAEMKALPTTIGLYLDLYRNAVLGSPNGYRLEFTNQGTVRLGKRVSGAMTYHGDPYPISPGDKVGIRWLDGVLSLVVNHVPVIEATVDVITRSGFSGFSGLNATTGFGVDQFSLSIY